MLCYMTYVHNRTERNMLYNMCHVMLYDICLKQNRTCAHVSYYTPGVMLCYITYVMSCYITCLVMLYNMCHGMLYNMCHVMLYNMSCYYITYHVSWYFI